MNNELNRREFMKLGVGSLAGFTAGQLLPSANQVQAEIAPTIQSIEEFQNGTFIFDQRAISQVDIQSNRVLESVYWGIPAEYQTLLPRLSSPLSVSPDELEAWVKTSCSGTCDIPETLSVPNPDWSSFETTMRVPTAGLPNMSDLIGKTMTTIMNGAPLNLSLDFLYNSQLEQAQKIYLPTIQNGVVQKEETVATIPAPDLITGLDQISAAAPTNVTMFGWKLQFRGPETHGLGSCVTQRVKHFHVEVFRQSSSGQWKYIFNVHLGAYRSSGRICFVLWNNISPYTICWKICSPTWSQLKEMFKWILIVAALIAAAVLAGWIISLIASAAATATFPVFLLLA